MRPRHLRYEIYQENMFYTGRTVNMIIQNCVDLEDAKRIWSKVSDISSGIKWFIDTYHHKTLWDTDKNIIDKDIPQNVKESVLSSFKSL